MKLKEIKKETFLKLVKDLNIPSRYDPEFLYTLLSDFFNSINEDDSGIFDNFNELNQLQLMFYILSELIYFTESLDDKTFNEKINDQDFLSVITSSALDKYIAVEKIEVKDPIFVSKYSPCISTLKIYLKFMAKSLGEFKAQNPVDKLINDYLLKAISISRCSLDLLVDGFESEAFSTWRTLHETECIITLFMKYQKEVVPAYLKHMTYSAAFRNMYSKEKCDEIFVQIKSEMRNFDLKSKDTKKYIEYGYLTAIPDIKLDQDYKLNFRDGVEKLAGLSSYSKLYEYSSEIAHSSPLMIYSDQKNLFHLTITLIYEVFFRLEKIFDIFFYNTKNETQIKIYNRMKPVYKSQMIYIYNKEKDIYLKLSSNKK